LLTIAVVIASAYSTLRYIYFGMFVQASPMRARRELLAGRPVHAAKIGLELEPFAALIDKEIDRYFPRVGKVGVTFEITQDAKTVQLKNIQVPRAVRLMCWIENFDFMLPIFANIGAITLWVFRHGS